MKAGPDHRANFRCTTSAVRLMLVRRASVNYNDRNEDHPHDAIPFARALVKAVPDRVLWGTDFPHPNVKQMPNDGELVDLFAAVCLDEALRRKVLIDNPTRLYWA